MKVIKIGAVWCPGCLVMRPRWAEIEKENPWLKTEYLDFDGDKEEVEKYHVEDGVLPAFIFLDKDIIATATAFTAEAIADNYVRFVKHWCALDTVIVSGGGAHNRALLSFLAEVLPDVRIETLDQHGMSPDAKEAIAFAWMADRTLRGLPSNHPPSTGARRSVRLGKISLP